MDKVEILERMLDQIVADMSRKEIKQYLDQKAKTKMKEFSDE